MKSFRNSIRSAALAGLTLLATTVSPNRAQSQVEPGQPAAAHAALLMRQLDGVKRVLMIAAHPDDEDSSLLATLSRGWGAQTAYLSLTRGDGGQNLIGPELGEGLGVIRTGELVAARHLDGGAQFFSRAYDFGYTKSAQETLAFWAEDEVLADAVWIIRSFRPHVIISQWSGTPRDGHGQHQASGLVAHEAFTAAADPTRFPDQLSDGVEPWQAKKLYRGFRRASDQNVLEVPTGSLDPLLGRSHFQLGMASRSMHQSQDMGVRQPAGPRVSRIELVGEPGASAVDDSPFHGIDTTLVSILEGVEGPEYSAIEANLLAYRESVRRARATLDVSSPWRASVDLGRALGQLRAATVKASALARPPRELTDVLASRMEIVEAAMLAAAGVSVEFRVDDDLLVPGEEVTVHVEFWNGGPLAITDAMPRLSVPSGWGQRWATEAEHSPPRTGFFSITSSAVQHEGPASVAPGELARWSYRLTVARDARLSRQYYLEQPRDGAMYQWPADRSLWGLPSNPPDLSARVSATLSGSDGEVLAAVAPFAPGQYVGVDRATGEFRRPVLVVPAVSVSMEPPRMVWPTESEAARNVRVQVVNEATAGSRGRVILELPNGWSAAPSEQTFDLSTPGASRSFTFAVSPSGAAQPGDHVFRALVRTEDGRSYREGMTLVDYPHIERVALFSPAEATVAAFSARVTDGLRVGYVMGSGDSGPTALRQLGVAVEELGPEAIRLGAFSELDVIVIGVRAYQTRPELTTANDQVLEFARRGGTVVVQYSQFDFSEGDYGPFPIQISRDRVAEEDAVVTILDPSSPVFQVPNRIGTADFDGWVQERGLYFPNEWDSRFRPLLSMADTGEDAKTGSLLVASVGEGVYVYSALSFFRQFPTGVQGAYRLFANLVSLDGDTWREYVAESEPQ